MTQTNFVVIGMGTMGSNLAFNRAQSGNPVMIFNRRRNRTDAFLADPANTGTYIPVYDYDELVSKLATPRVALIMVAHKGVQPVINELLDRFEPGDIIIDGGNSHFEDTQARQAVAAEKGIHFLGIGISGGELGARYGASLMAGGNPEAWRVVEPIIKSVAAKIPDGVCAEFMGPGGAGHYVKTVHNGIEYAIMELIAEVYGLITQQQTLGEFNRNSQVNIAKVFEEWNANGRLGSYLIEITSKILEKTDQDGPLVDFISDVAGQKGTGLWTVQDALRLLVPTPTLLSAVNSRIMSGLAERKLGQQLIPTFASNQPANLVNLERALYLGFVAAYAQGFQVLAEASKVYEWDLDLGEIARIWKAGCIIRSDLLETIQELYKNGYTGNLALAEPFRDDLEHNLQSLHEELRKGVGTGSVSALATVSDYYYNLQAYRLPLNLTQAQRDTFGAHTYVDTRTEEVVHTDWLH